MPLISKVNFETRDEHSSKLTLSHDVSISKTQTWKATSLDVTLGTYITYSRPLKKYKKPSNKIRTEI